MTKFRHIIYIWKNRLAKFIDNPWALYPFVRKHLFYRFVADTYIPYYKQFHFLDYSETLEYAMRHDLSIIRFGDELFDMLEGIGVYFGNWRQRYHPGIAAGYKRIISSRDPRLLVCFNPQHIFKSKEEYAKAGIPDQWQFWINSKIFLKDYIHQDVTYGSAHCFYPSYNQHIDYGALSAFFRTKHIIIITSNTDRFESIDLGKTTDLIEAPQSDAWDQYEAIKKETMRLIAERAYPFEDVLILGSASATTRILIYELMTEHGIRGWDTGQFFDLAHQEIKKHLSANPHV